MVNDGTIREYKPGIWEHYEDISQNRGQIEGKAELVGQTCLFADALTLQLDLDTPEAVEHFHHQWNWFCCQLDFLFDQSVLNQEMKSRSGNTHVIIKLAHPLEATERLLLQALLGSDLKRELLNYTRLKTKGEDLTCLFRPKPLLLETSLKVLHQVHEVDNAEAPELFYRVVNTDNFGGDYPNESFVGPEMLKEDAQVFCDSLNKPLGDHSSRYHKVVEGTYELQPGFEP